MTLLERRLVSADAREIAAFYAALALAARSPLGLATVAVCLAAVTAAIVLLRRRRVAHRG